MADEYEFMDTQDISENGPNTSEDSVNAEEDNESNDANDAGGAEGNARAVAQASFSDAAKKVASKGMKVAILPSAKGKAKSEKLPLEPHRANQLRVPQEVSQRRLTKRENRAHQRKMTHLLRK